MKLYDFLNLYDLWGKTVTINNNRLKPIVVDTAYNIMKCIPTLNGMENYEKLFNMKVVAFGIYNDELCVRVKQQRGKRNE